MTGSRAQLFPGSILLFTLLLAFTILPAPMAIADQEAPPAGRASSANKELERQLESLKSQVQALQQKVDTLGQAKPSPSPTGNGAGLQSLRSEVRDLKNQLEYSRLGATKLLLTGSFQAGFRAPENDNTSFSTQFSPLVLWELNKDLLFEGQIAFELEDGKTVTSLEYADIAYSINDYMTIAAGKFLDPANIFIERYHPSWVYPFPDLPLAVHDGILPESDLGVQVRGGIPIPLGKMHLNYAFFVGNGPALHTEGDEAGTLDFENFQDNNNDKAFGGRIGLLPVPSFEVGYAVEFSRVSSVDSAQGRANSVLQSLDFDHGVDWNLVRGHFDLRGQWAWSHVSPLAYTLDDGSMVAFSNNRNGGYVQASYRPTKLGRILKDFEFLTRYDRLDTPRGAPGDPDEDRTTLGIDYWLESSTVVKLAYEIDVKHAAPDNSAFLAALAAGF